MVEVVVELVVVLSVDFAAVMPLYMHPQARLSSGDLITQGTWEGTIVEMGVFYVHSQIANRRVRFSTVGTMHEVHHIGGGGDGGGGDGPAWKEMETLM